MKETIEKLWYDYLCDECAVIASAEERTLTSEAAELHEKANALLNEEQKAAIEKYIDALYAAEAVFLKKAFFTGCKFAASFLLELGIF